MAVRPQFTRKISPSSSSERAMATSKFPLPVSSTIAVVSVRVCPLMLPPTIMEAPISEMTPPKPAMTAASMGRRASCSTIHTIWAREAPSARSWSRNSRGTCWTAASVIPVTMGEAITAWAITMAAGVYRISQPPSGPLRHRRSVTKSPTTTGGRPIPVFTALTTIPRPGKRASASAADFTAPDNGLKPVKLSEATGKVIILSSVPSLDTPTCDTETRRFNQEAAKLGAGVEIWTISRDLPFAQKRWCGAAGVTSVKTLSDFRERAFGPAYGVEIKDGPIAGLTARAVFVVGKDGKVKHVEYVKEIGSEPNYEAALAAAKSAAS